MVDLFLIVGKYFNLFTINFWAIRHNWMIVVHKVIRKQNEHIFNSNAGQKPAEGWFLSKWVYNFLPAQNLAHLSHHIGGGQLPKNTHKIL